jgi:hypothetical protein
MGQQMRADILERLNAIARGDIVSVPAGTPGTPGTPGTAGLISASPPGTLNPVPSQKSPSFQAFQVFQVEHDVLGGLPDDITEAERAAIAIELGRVPDVYAEAWAAFQVRMPKHSSEAKWQRAVDDAGRFLDQWAMLALSFGWRACDIFARDGLAWFCEGESVRALGPDNAVTDCGRTFTRPGLRDVPW